MGQAEYLIDSNAIIDYLGNKFPPSGTKFMNTIIDNLPIISVISRIEILGFNTTPEHYTVLSNFIDDLTILNLNNNIVDIVLKLENCTKQNYQMQLSLQLQ